MQAQGASAVVTQRVTNPTRIHEDVDSVLELTYATEAALKKKKKKRMGSTTLTKEAWTPVRQKDRTADA